MHALRCTYHASTPVIIVRKGACHPCMHRRSVEIREKRTAASASWLLGAVEEDAPRVTVQMNDI